MENSTQNTEQALSHERIWLIMLEYFNEIETLAGEAYGSSSLEDKIKKERKIIETIVEMKNKSILLLPSNKPYTSEYLSLSKNTEQSAPQVQILTDEDFAKHGFIPSTIYSDTTTFYKRVVRDVEFKLSYHKSVSVCSLYRHLPKDRIQTFFEEFYVHSPEDLDFLISKCWPYQRLISSIVQESLPV